jgi:hypothetical protein
LGKTSSKIGPAALDAQKHGRDNPFAVADAIRQSPDPFNMLNRGKTLPPAL